MRRHKGEWVFTDEEVDQNEQLMRATIRAIKRLLKQYPTVEDDKYGFWYDYDGKKLIAARKYAQKIVDKIKRV